MRKSLRPSTTIGLVLLVVACANAIDRIVGPPDTANPTNALANVSGDTRLIFGPRVFIRGAGSPATETMTLEGFAPNAILRIVNGTSTGEQFVSSGRVLVDGVEVVHPSAFNQRIATIEVPITLRNTSTISLTLSSAPGDQVTLSVEGQLATSAPLSPAGGTLHFLGDQVTLTAPPGAVGTTVELTGVPTPTARPEVFPGSSMDFGPPGTTFASPVTLAMAFDPSALPAGVRASSLRLKWWNVDHWESLSGNVVDEVHHVVSAQTTHFTTFALLANEVVFCPGDAGAEQDLRTAITHVPENGTVYVCDGTYAVAPVLIDKPLTLRSLNPGGATLRDAEAGGNIQQGTPMLRISGVASGLVRIADLGIAVTDQAIRPWGVFDRVEIDSVRFVGEAGSDAVAVRIDSAAIPTARVDVSRSDFRQLSLGVWPLSAVETNVRTSHFDRFVGGGVSYSHGNSATTQSFGRIEDNVFTNCGSSGCIRVLTAGGVTVARNRLEAQDQSVTLGAITLQATAAYPNAAPIIIEDNVIVSRRTGAAESTAAGWMFQSGIYVSDPNLRTSIIRRNHVTDAYSAVTSTGSLTATDNWFSGGFYALRQTTLRDVTFQRNDAVGLLGSFTVPTAGTSVQCNWWGSAAGPTAPPASSQGLYTPWATEPIAGTSVACTPVPVPPVPPLASLTLNWPQIGLTPGGTVQFVATGRDANGNIVGVAPTWSVVNGGGTISSSGVFTAGTSPGTFTSTVRATSGVISASATVIVGNIASLSLSPSSAFVVSGGTQAFTAIGRDAAGNVISLPRTPMWAVVNGGGSISSSGLFTAGAVMGSFPNTISATFETLTATASVTVRTASSPQVRVCTTSTDSITVSTIADALSWVASGGTIKLCDGTHVTAALSITKPVTITAEGPGVPELRASGSSAQVSVSGRTPGSVTISKLRLRNISVSIDTGSVGAVLTVEDNDFVGCTSAYCVNAATTARIVRNSLTIQYASPVSSPIRIGVAVGAPASTSYAVTDNSITGIGNDFTRTNWWERYPITSAAINVFSGTVEVARNQIANSFWGIIGSAASSWTGFSILATDNVVQSTYYPIGTVGSEMAARSLVANWNDILNATFDIGGPQITTLNLRCNWWGKTSAPKLMNNQAPPASVYTPWALAPVAGQPHTGCDPSGN
jgi:hypothetical protein